MYGVGHTLEVSTGNHMNARRAAREVERSPEIAAIPVGSALVREYQGKPYIVTRAFNAWFYEGAHYPTLYAVMCAALGTKVVTASGRTRYVPQWSGHRFFGLRTRTDEIRRKGDVDYANEFCDIVACAADAYQRYGLPFDAARANAVPW